MRHTIAILLAAATAATAATPAFAQQQQGANAANASVNATKSVWQFSHDYVLRAAEQVPESLYSYRPTPEVRSFGQLFAHVAGAEYMMCAAAMGEPPRAEDDIEKTKTTKADLVAALKASGTFCERAYGMSDAASSASIKFFGEENTKLFALSMNAAHDAEHYGNIVTYMRMKGLTPPSSQR